MDEDTHRFLLRMPVGLRDALRDSAEVNGRSLNREIVARLEASLAFPPRPEMRTRVSAVAAAAALGVSLFAGSALGTAAGAGYAALSRSGDAGMVPAQSESRQQLLRELAARD